MKYGGMVSKMSQGGPLGHAQDAVVTGGVSVGEVGDGAEEISDGTPPGGEDGGHAQQPGADKRGRGREGGLKQIKQRQVLAGYTIHKGLLGGRSVKRVPTFMLPPGRPCS